eukprot:77754-Rhodomonas_salina.1
MKYPGTKTSMKSNSFKCTRSFGLNFIFPNHTSHRLVRGMIVVLVKHGTVRQQFRDRTLTLCLECRRTKRSQSNLY